MPAPLAASAATSISAADAPLVSDTGTRARAIRTLLVGTGHRAVRIARALTADPDKHLLVGAIDSKRQPELGATLPGVRWLGGPLDLRQRPFGMGNTIDTSRR